MKVKRKKILELSRAIADLMWLEDENGYVVPTFTDAHSLLVEAEELVTEILLSNKVHTNG